MWKKNDTRSYMSGTDSENLEQEIDKSVKTN